MRSFEEIISLLEAVSKEIQIQNERVAIRIEKIDSRSITCMAYKDGVLVRGVKIYRKNIFSGSESIFLSDCTHCMGSDNSCNGQYSYINANGEMKLHAMLSFGVQKKEMDAHEVVKDIWENYISPYLKR